MGVALNREKTKIVGTLKDEAFGFLGFDLRRLRKRDKDGYYVNMTPKKKARKAIKAKIREIIVHGGALTAQALIKKINDVARNLAGAVTVTYLEDYGLDLAAKLVSGVDIWLNNPIAPREASGTSGMKAALNGVPSLSILDGWWREGYDGTNGFAIGQDSNSDSVEEQDKVDSANLYQTLTEQVIPTFFDRDAQGVPRKWIQMIRRAMATLVPQFSTRRMVKEYTEKYYLAK